MVRRVAAVAVVVLLAAGCTGGSGRPSASSSPAAGRSASSAAAPAGPVAVNGLSTTPTVTDTGAAAAPGRGIEFASHVFALGPSGPLPSSATVTIKLERALPAGTPVVAATRESTSQPWTYLPATLSGDGASATFTTPHLSLFGILWLDTKDLAAAFKSDFIDGVTGGLTQTVTKPTCQHESEARGDGYTITSSNSDAVYWCFGIENGTRVLKVTVHRRYPMEIAHPNMDVISNHYNHIALSALSHLTSGNATIVEPGGTAVFNADLPADGGVRGGESISTQMDGLGQSLYALQVGIETLTNILTRFGAGADKKAIDYFGDALQAHSCIQGLAEGTSGAIISGCLNPKQILDIYGVKGLLLAPVMAIGGIIAFFHSEYNALIDQFNHHDKYTILIKRKGRTTANVVRFDGIGSITLGMAASQLASLGYSHRSLTFGCDEYYKSSTSGYSIGVDQRTARVVYIGYFFTSEFRTAAGIAVGSTLQQIRDAYAGQHVVYDLNGQFGQASNGVLVQGPGGWIGFGLDGSDQVNSLRIGSEVTATSSEFSC